ncbi:MAG: YceI family protein [Chitinophagales bacterium]
MKKSMGLFSILSLITITVYAAVAALTIDTTNSSATFSIVNMGLTVEGKFNSGVIGEVVFDKNDLSSSTIEAHIKTKSIDTGIEMRDNHLRNADYFEVEKYPKISFKSTEITKTSSGYIATGKFTMKDVTKTVKIPFTYQNNTFTGNFDVSRVAYHVGEKSWVMRDKVNVTFKIPVR